MSVHRALVFNEELHEYRDPLKNRVVPSVTTILSEVGLYPDFSCISDFYPDRGRKVHKACHLLDMGALILETLDSRIKGFVLSYQKFKEAFCAEIEASEQIVWHVPLDYCGTLDKRGRLVWRGDRIPFLGDLKCGQPEPEYALQLAGYALPLHPDERYTRKRLGIYLDKDGKLPRVVPYEDHRDFSTFQAAVTVYHARRKRK